MAGVVYWLVGWSVDWIGYIIIFSVFICSYIQALCKSKSFCSIEHDGVKPCNIHIGRCYNQTWYKIITQDKGDAQPMNLGWMHGTE
ncbi:hypothetical protein BO78DRAFT_182270 [Aspergillus sclerotiicarbonarius CBS 121057]|uniref:Uncharacterized protein n=1 Tax=Aspergillus sclerotiicarbonarius (strain CBS 121057 / IBT 28362) TaxID=1448318 RepID=A0A319EZW2_ASPSB|nr:hypothetical protein BO78DRAFT_182270 [Aspergillus sclerotiicarbonarius CBS 121057]